MVLSVVGMMAFLSCNKDDDNNNNSARASHTITGNATGNQEVPPVVGAGTATLTGTYDTTTNQLVYDISWSGLSGVLVGAHFHGPAAIGAEASIIHSLPITVNGTSGYASGTITIADSTEVHLLTGKIYYNLHTTNNPDGEIRGQVVATPY